jgi:protein TonB
MAIRSSVALHILAVAAVVSLGWASRKAPVAEAVDSAPPIIFPPGPPFPPPARAGSPTSSVTRAQRRQARPLPESAPSVEAVPEPVVALVDPSPEPVRGVTDGDANALAEGEGGGRPGGQTGGVPDGVENGILGGTGRGPVPVRDYDRPPRLTSSLRPVYPQPAFVTRTQGRVVVEILIDADGSVVDTRVVVSIPALDAAAVECVRQWRFEPAMKHGRPVPTIAIAPVDFIIH